jgi:hypothetical protein
MWVNSTTFECRKAVCGRSIAWAFSIFSGGREGVVKSRWKFSVMFVLVVCLVGRKEGKVRGGIIETGTSSGTRHTDREW